ncbi:MAG: outer membrane protein assembly factor BamE [Gammaproteobacteria bacterium]|nr:outer membrane protein assembly factor BamE [Gammaproteobacteria bacterium]MCY4164891.1 outer membrane protein assembly factor BamE [Gammaproteobacteria bacterium]MCY4255341.1 outer membrane protein assembly factor BamE [Gammaproteobacteria bacterium]MCY4340518.1 outer membrane protein assembly factor BamE [Gammaproteobacteria bacterium]
MKHYQTWRNLVLAAGACVVLSSCIYQVRVFQGSIVDPGDMEKVEIGMTREQVAYVLGTPTVSDPFHADRWDYVLTDGTLEGERQLVVIHFSDQGVSAVNIAAAPQN